MDGIGDIGDTGQTSTALSRRGFLGRLLAASVVTAVAGPIGPSGLRAALAGAAVVPSAGPYGPLAATPDANGFQLPAGFTSRLLATTGAVVAGTGYRWHGAPDGGACFPRPDGGWVYVSNSELSGGAGGASALAFDTTGTVVDAYRILSGTNRNCAGGPTVRGTWLSCEESGAGGRVYECDPLRPGQGVVRPALGSFNHEAAFEDPVTGIVYLTEDEPVGRLYRFVPTTRGDLSAGGLFAARVSNGVITWVPTSAAAPDRQATTTAFDGGEGLWIEGRTMYVTTKGDRRVWEIDLDTMAISVLYDGRSTPGSALDAVDNCTVHRPSGDVFVCEDGGNMEVGVIALMPDGTRHVAPFLRIVGHTTSEWCGVAFSPDHRRMYLSSQRGSDGRTGHTYEITGPFRSATGLGAMLVARGSTWRYDDTGADHGTVWRAGGFDDRAWKTGRATLGYGDVVATTIGFGPDPARKHITTYFRHTFTPVRGYRTMVLRLRRDDGAVVYLNGVEVARSNMPAGAVTAATRAASTLNEPAERAYVEIPVTGTLYHGPNTVAVEVHQAAPGSSDLAFDLEVVGTGAVVPLAPPPVRLVGASEDAHVRDGAFAATTFATATVAEVGSSSRGNRWFYVKFDTGPLGAPPLAARLRLRIAGAAGVTTTVELCAAPTTWRADTLTWDNRPAAGASLGTRQVTGGTAALHEWDVTGHVLAERAAGRREVAFVLRMPTRSGVVLTVPTSEWSGAALRPVLAVTG